VTIKRLPRPRDPVQLGKLMVDIATGQLVDAVEDGKSEQASKHGREGGMKGGRARAEALTGQQRSEIAKKAAQSRWKRHSS
jgi:hypothetical protein